VDSVFNKSHSGISEPGRYVQWTCPTLVFHWRCKLKLGGSPKMNPHGFDIVVGEQEESCSATSCHLYREYRSLPNESPNQLPWTIKEMFICESKQITGLTCCLKIQYGIAPWRIACWPPQHLLNASEKKWPKKDSPWHDRNESRTWEILPPQTCICQDKIKNLSSKWRNSNVRVF